MKFAVKVALCLIAGLFICAGTCFPASAAEPPCLPKQLGSTGTDFKTGFVDDVGWLGWQCQVDGNPVLYGFIWDRSYAVKHPNIAGMTPIQTARAYYDLNVVPLLMGAKYAAAHKAMRTAFGVP